MYKEKWLSLFRKLATFVLLLIVLISILKPPPKLREITSRTINLNKARNYNCVDEIIPQDVDVLFVGNLSGDQDGSNTTALYYRAQYFLAPRLVHFSETTELESQLERFFWFLETTIDTEHMIQLNDRYQLALLKSCDDLHVLQKTDNP